MQKSLEDIRKNVRVTLSSQDWELIDSAYEFAKAAHQGQKRRSGEDYIIHGIETAIILAQIGMGAKTISAGLLHDVPEDTPVTLAEIENKFGKEIAFLVNGITKLGKIKLRDKTEEMYVKNLRKLFLAMADDIRVIIIKLADRLHNMRTLQFNPRDKQIRIAKETLEIFSLIANRLGMGKIKSELEDLAFKYLDQENYAYSIRTRKEQYLRKKEYFEATLNELTKEFSREKVEILQISKRIKHPYSLFCKLKKRGMDIEKIYDFFAIRIIVPEISNCYEALGIVHRKYKPLVGRVKDYISLPKPNGYQSIHTTVFGPEGIIVEAQIRTKKMDEEAMFGIAAHWLHKNQEKKSILEKYLFPQKEEEKENKELRWVKQFSEWQSDIGADDQEFMCGLQVDFFKNHIFAFTPTGDFIELPEEATPVDFAYCIHSEIGRKICEAKADGKIVPLDYHIQNGQLMEIFTSDERVCPDKDWLKFVKTSTAKRHIRKFFKK